MKEKFLVFLALIFLTILLVGLNAASYVQKEKTPDDEFNPNRSTYNTGATGTRALYDLLAETERKVSRWQEPMSALSPNNKNKPSTFVVIGKTRREFTDKEIEQLLNWVAAGGKLVIIDRQPPEELIKTTASWNITATEAPILCFDPANQNQMTEKTVAAKSLQPTVFTQKVNAVQPSRLASSISFERFSEEEEAKEQKEAIETIALNAPVLHLANDEKNLLVDFPFGLGQIVFLSDPFIVSNGGIALIDNAQLAVNILTSHDGIIAFDEYHQGYGANNNRLLEYFAETPLVAFFLQFAVLIGLIFLAQSVRFARPLPTSEQNRLSKLEYVSAMAQLQQRTRAFDLAIENIYTDFRRRASRSLGVDNYAVSLKELAEMIAKRTNENQNEIETLMFKCEEIVRGEPTDKKEVLQITSRLRKLEEKLGLLRRKRK